MAEAIRSQTERILDEWRGRTLFSVPDASDLTQQEFRDGIAAILSAVADALESNDPADLRRLVQMAPEHGFQRFLLDYDLADVFAEERILRRVIVTRVEETLDRQCHADEAAALHSMIDIMLQQGVLALVLRQKQELRESAEAELKYLSFLSHDLGNNLFVIRANLERLEKELSQLPEMRRSADTLRAAIHITTRTAEGMRALLAHERLRKSGDKPRIAPVKIKGVADPIVQLLAGEDEASALPTPHIEVAIDPEATAHTDANLLTIILQNLIGNAVKHTVREGRDGDGMVRIGAQRVMASAGGLWRISVSDDGPGIAEEDLEHLFEPFKTLPEAAAHASPATNATGGDRWEAGAGLGLAIAWQAARLLGTTIDVKSRVNEGSTFSFVLPAA